jgi:hypothetical protein
MDRRRAARALQRFRVRARPPRQPHRPSLSHHRRHSQPVITNWENTRRGEVRGSGGEQGRLSRVKEIAAHTHKKRSRRLSPTSLTSRGRSSRPPIEPHTNKLTTESPNEPLTKPLIQPRTDPPTKPAATHPTNHSPSLAHHQAHHRSQFTTEVTTEPHH